jgi:hypothetical protein
MSEVKTRGSCTVCKTTLMEFIPEVITFQNIKEIKQSFGPNCPVCNKKLVIDFKYIIIGEKLE